MFFQIWFFLLGTIVGSFFNVCIARLPLGKSIIFPPSSCPRCGHRIRFYDNIPVLSYMLLRGRCRDCKEQISPIYPLVELTGGVLFLTLFINDGLSLKFLEHIILLSILLIGGVIDLRHSIIPNLLTYLGLATGLVFSLIDRTHTIERLLGFCVGFGGFYLISLLSLLILKKEGMGGGDIKLAGVIGLFLGWQLVLFAFYIASFLAALVGVIYIAIQKGKDHHRIPFGPFLAIGSLVVVFFGKSVLTFIGIYL